MISVNIKELELEYKYSDNNAEVIITDVYDNNICIGDLVKYKLLENSWVYRCGKLTFMNNNLYIECYDQIFRITYYIKIIDNRYKPCPNCGCKNKGDYCLHCFYKFEKKELIK